MTYLGNEEYRRFVATMPIACVDGLLVDGDQIYLFQRSPNDAVRGQWWLMGGRVLKGETRRQAIARKAREELGVEVDIAREIGTYDVILPESERHPGGYHAVATVFLIRPASTPFRLKLSDEYESFATFRTPPAGLHAYVERVIRDSRCLSPPGGDPFAEPKS
jgi:colanic acid biosynthesis protein WcaH